MTAFLTRARLGFILVLLLLCAYNEGLRSREPVPYTGSTPLDLNPASHADLNLRWRSKPRRLTCYGADL